MSALPKGWTVEKLMANRHMGAALLGDTIEEGKAIRAAIDRLLTRSGGGAFGPALLANSPEEVETLKRELRGETVEAPCTCGPGSGCSHPECKGYPLELDDTQPPPRKRNRSKAA